MLKHMRHAAVCSDHHTEGWHLLAMGMPPAWPPLPLKIACVKDGPMMWVTTPMSLPAFSSIGPCRQMSQEQRVLLDQLLAHSIHVDPCCILEGLPAGIVAFMQRRIQASDQALLNEQRSLAQGFRDLEQR